MIGIFHYIMMNSRSLIFSIFGLPLLIVIIGRTSGFRHSMVFNVLLGTIMWGLRYFGLTLYVSTYLGNKYAEEIWFARLMVILTVLNVFMGIVGVAVLFEGSLRKNLLLMIVLEVVLTSFYLVGFVLLIGDTKGEYTLMNTSNPSDILIIPCFVCFYLLLVKFADPWMERYRNWEPGHPIFIDLVLMFYFLWGIYNNTTFALSKGDPGILVLVLMCLLLTGYLWVGYFYKENKKQEMVRQKLLRYEHALKVHSQQVIEQSLKMNRYHSGIKKAMEALSDRILQMETGGSAAFGTDEANRAFEAGNRSEMVGLAQTYMAGLEQHYREITISKYSDDVSLNEMLVACEKRFADRDIPFQIQFHHFKLPDNLSEDDLERLLDWLADQIIRQHTDNNLPAKAKEEKGEDDKEAGTHEDMNDHYTVLQGGMIKRELILSCQYPGSLPSGTDQRKLRRLLKPMHADMYMNYEGGYVKLTIGLPADI